MWRPSATIALAPGQSSPDVYQHIQEVMAPLVIFNALVFNLWAIGCCLENGEVFPRSPLAQFPPNLSSSFQHTLAVT